MGYLPCEENWVVRRGTIYNYGPLCRETSRFVNLRGKLFFPRVDKSGCFLTQRAVIVLLYFCQCFLGYLPCGGKLGCSAGNNKVVRRRTIWLFPGSANFCQCLIGYLLCGGKLGCSAGNNVQLLPALKLNNYDVHRKCRQYLIYYTETLFTIMLDAINTYLCVFINFIFVFLTSGQDCNSGMQKRIHFRTDVEHYIYRPCFPGVPIL
jgi:hypothetical protein